MGRPPLPPDQRKPRKSGPSGKSRPVDAPVLEANRLWLRQRAEALGYGLPPGGAEPVKGWKAAVAASLDVTAAAVGQVWRGEMRLPPEWVAKP